MSVPYVRPNAPTFRIIIINHFNLLRNLVSTFAEYDSDLLLVGFTFLFNVVLICLYL